jgi:lipoprotein-anchoring transpeptidase ErfK/SrfK
MTRKITHITLALVGALALLAGCDVPPEATTNLPPTGTTSVVTRGPVTPPVAERIAALSSPGPNKVLAIVDVSDQRLTVVRGFDDGRPPEQYHWLISSGIERKPTPFGQFYPDFLSPRHVSSIYNVPMPWSVFFNGNIAIHGDPDARMLGQRASHGCVRVHPVQAEIFYRMVEEVGLRNTTIVVRD